MKLWGGNIGKFLVVILFVLGFILTPNVIRAESPESLGLTPQKTLPGSALYPIKRLKEKFTELTSFSSEAKIKYGIILLEKRLSELASLVERKDPIYLESSSQRLSAQAGNLADYASTLDTERKELVLSYFKAYTPPLNKLRDNYPANYAYWLSIQQNIDTLNILSEKLK